MYNNSWKCTSSSGFFMLNHCDICILPCTTCRFAHWLLKRTYTYVTWTDLTANYSSGSLSFLKAFVPKTLLQHVAFACTCVCACLLSPAINESHRKSNPMTEANTTQAYSGAYTAFQDPMWRITNVLVWVCTFWLHHLWKICANHFGKHTRVDSKDESIFALFKETVILFVLFLWQMCSFFFWFCGATVLTPFLCKTNTAQF